MLRETPLQIEIERSDQNCIVRASGTCSMDAALKLDEALHSAAKPPGMTVLLDLSALEFIDSSGLGGIVKCHLHCRRQGGQLRLVSPRPVIHDLLKLTKLTELIPVDDSLPA